MRIIDLFCGIGGVAEASRDLADTVCTPVRLSALAKVLPEVVAAIDIDGRITPIYAVNHRIEPIIQTLESIRSIPQGDVWWLSPPCQPYTRRGKQRAEQDPRSLGLAHIIELIAQDLPKGILLENVPGFHGSLHHELLERTLCSANYSIRVDELCPTQWKVPMRRRRFYLRARRDGAPIEPVDVEPLGRPLPECLDESAWDDPSLSVPGAEQSKFGPGMDVLDTSDPTAIAACFTSAYGKSPVHAGSYLRSPQRESLRRFSPQEIGRLMGYREGFWWPDELSLRGRYQLLGNSLSVTVVRALLASMIDVK